MNGDTDGSRLVGNGSRDGLTDPPGRIGRELEALGIIELINSLNKTYVAFLNKVKEVHSAADVFLCDADDKTSFAKVDVDKQTLTRVEGFDSGLSYGETTTVATSNNMYAYAYFEEGMDATSTSIVRRLTYDAQTNEMMVEDLSETLHAAAPALGDSAEPSGIKAHVAMAGLPDGLALVGAPTDDKGAFILGQDTSVIYDGATAAVKLDRTSTYHRAFDPLATYYDGKLYVTGLTATEPGVMYFRATHIHTPDKDQTEVTAEPTCTEPGKQGLVCSGCGQEYERPVPMLWHSWGTWTKVNEKQHQRICSRDASHVETADHTWGSGKVTKAAAPGADGVRTFTCTACKATKTQAIKALPGGVVGKSYKSSGCTYKVTSNAKNTVTLAKAKNAKSVTVPAKVKIAGKTYKVAGIAPKAFKGKKKVKKLVVKTKLLTKKSVKGSLKGSKVKTVKVKVGAKKANKKFVKKYKKIFTKKNAGRKVKVK